MSNSILGKTVPVGLELGPTDSRRVWVHVFRDHCRAISEAAELFEDPGAFEEKWTNCNDDVMIRGLEESDTLSWFKKPTRAPEKCRLVRDDKTIAGTLERTSLFASVFTMECSTRFALDTYGQHDSVEKCFMAGKTILNMDVLRAHETHTMEGRYIDSFVALTLLCELKHRMAAPKSVIVKDGICMSLANKFTWNSLMSLISRVKVIYGGYECRFAEVTKRQHKIADRLACPYLYNFVPSFFSTPS